MDYEKLNRIYYSRDKYEGGYWTDIDSGTTVYDTIGFMEQEAKEPEQTNLLSDMLNDFGINGYFNSLIIALLTVLFALAIQLVIKIALEKTFGRSKYSVVVKHIYLIGVPIIMYNMVSQTMAIISLGYAIKHVFGWDNALPPYRQTFFALKHGRTGNYAGYAVMLIGLLSLLNFGHL